MNSEQFIRWCQTDFSHIQNYRQKPLVMGVLNITLDSFSDGGLFLQPEKAYAQAMLMIDQGADLIDIGGESTRPGAKPVSCDEELERVIPVIQAIRKVSDTCISIDTSKAAVMEAAVKAGATLINDVYALQKPGALAVAAELKVPICLMHMQGTPQSMQINPHYENDIVDEINAFFSARIKTCLDAGIAKEYLLLDPGFGFGKTVRHNLNLLNRLQEFHQHNRPILLGASRKSTLGTLLNKDVNGRVAGGLAVLIFAAMQGIKLIRTHDVAESVQALTILDAIIKEEV